ncbi:hypothetical protein ACIBSW_24850 [Actinoplanes sp. NPDC049668]|uniref:hypothetical protein n=1 Tax=unclassified Actinoplanes TaxID=2626549 RepID=UPI0033A6A994
MRRHVNERNNMIINLTPHPLYIFPADTPDNVDAGSVTPWRILEPSPDHRPARLGQQVIDVAAPVDGIPTDLVAFGSGTTDVTELPPPLDNTWYVVALVVGVAAHHRGDLLALHEYVRDLEGRIIGARKLARPHHGRPA